MSDDNDTAQKPIPEPTPPAPPTQAAPDMESSRHAARLWGTWSDHRPGERRRFPYAITD
jgi:hypothetical protein